MAVAGLALFTGNEPLFGNGVCNKEGIVKYVGFISGNNGEDTPNIFDAPAGNTEHWLVVSLVTSETKSVDSLYWKILLLINILLTRGLLISFIAVPSPFISHKFEIFVELYSTMAAIPP